MSLVSIVKNNPPLITKESISMIEKGIRFLLQDSMPSRKLYRRDQIKPKRDSTRLLTGLSWAKLDGSIPTDPIEAAGKTRSSRFVSV